MNGQQRNYTMVSLLLCGGGGGSKISAGYVSAAQTTKDNACGQTSLSIEIFTDDGNACIKT
jgi:hypothetical protein